jgi:benzoyl-CoA reductase/2-hydroxyglutaryl-CoA dehydratase subunit BcrC/BadD/HgdB
MQTYWLLAAAHAQEGRFAEALRDLAELERRVETGGSPRIELAQIRLGLGERDRVIETLEEADAPGVAFQPLVPGPGLEPG